VNFRLNSGDDNNNYHNDNDDDNDDDDGDDDDDDDDYDDDDDNDDNDDDDDDGDDGDDDGLYPCYTMFQLTNPQRHKPPFKFATIPHGSTDTNIQKNYPDMYQWMKPFNKSDVKAGVNAVKNGFVIGTD